MAPVPTSVMSGQLYLKQHGQRVQSFGSPRLDRLLIDLREDPDARKALDRRVRRQQAEASPRRPPPPTAQQRLLAALHLQAAEEARRDATAESPLEAAPDVGGVGPLAAAKVDTELASEDGRDMFGEEDPAAALVPVWGEDDEPPPGAAAPKPPPTPREQLQTVEEILRSERPHPPQSTDTPWTVEVVARARGHWNVDPMSLMPGATVRPRVQRVALAAAPQLAMSTGPPWQRHGSLCPQDRLGSATARDVCPCLAKLAPRSPPGCAAHSGHSGHATAVRPGRSF